MGTTPLNELRQPQLVTASVNSCNLRCFLTRVRGHNNMKSYYICMHNIMLSVLRSWFNQWVGLVHSGWSHRARQGTVHWPCETLRCRLVALCGATARQCAPMADAHHGGAQCANGLSPILVGLVSTSTWLDWTWLASNQVQMDLV